ncbi:Histidine-specific methyltransferase EgtD [Legionella beliardensis]|uniref:Histidine-specific methyltransferase EgtD n=1 Tax=Legionella beliardensis TaxID=91822 RepID=A0A378HZ35_9GAMM|nr:L-histidine N(alpha)-methyltransferase [Legionella beliardensis]STX28198.1 Histidine-specific methyltransferase EgtD [Legionella beliardensis]
MNENLKITTLDYPPSLEDSRNTFLADILTGLTSSNKFISSKYFYDEKGSELFNLITRHPDYYLTNCELEILRNYKGELSQLLGQQGFNLIELGPGEGIKSRILIEQFLQDSLEFTYFTIDISRKYLNQIVKKFNHDLPNLKLIALNSDYFKGLRWLNTQSVRKNLLLFLGSSIGNFSPENTQSFLREIWQDLNDGDYFLIGFDLRKDIDILLRAYNDSDGITRKFNYNLLHRLNRELGANFKPELFYHYAPYNVYSGAMESYLISSQEQTIFIKDLDRAFHFNEFEPIHLEFSYKYLLSQISDFAQENGFSIIKNFFDSKKYFVDSLWQVHK